ncbi:hypothetical protein [Gracilibacillus xinjiangensis]|uniref:Uncharacterized protein n=1 Tax=Gracilibacillus xinjiangensis TaxID=1193282 RepID=A0ABV8X100_9BACI
MGRLETIRASEKQYHDYCYDKNKLFEQGSWLHRPVKTVIELVPLLKGINQPYVSRS